MTEILSNQYKLIHMIDCIHIFIIFSCMCTTLHSIINIKYAITLFCMKSRSGVPASNQYQVQEEVGRPLSYGLRAESSVKTLHTNFEVDVENNEVSLVYHLYLET